MESSKVLKGFRAKRLLSQDDLANKINVSRQMYNIYENNLLKCEFDLVFKILNAIAVDETELLQFLNALKQDYMSYNGN